MPIDADYTIYGDPAPGRSKSLLVTFNYAGGANLTRTAAEGGTITFDSGKCAKSWYWTAPKTTGFGTGGINVGSILSGLLKGGSGGLLGDANKKVDFVFKFMMWWTCAEWAIMCCCCLTVCFCVMCGMMCFSKELIHMSKVRMARSIPLAELYTGTKDADPNNPEAGQENNDVEMMQKNNMM